MKKSLMFVGLFLILSLSVFVSAQELENSNNFITETITCKFKDLTTGEPPIKPKECGEFFRYGNIEIPTEEIKDEVTGHQYTAELNYQCSGIGECSITIKGERGSKFKWASFCSGKLNEAGIKTPMELITNPNHTTIIDGTDKTIEFECVERSVAGKVLLSITTIFKNFFKKLFLSERVGYRDGYVLCYDGEELILDNDSPFCKDLDYFTEIFENQCRSRCDVNEFNCGFATTLVDSGCDLKNPENDIEIPNQRAYLLE